MRVQESSGGVTLWASADDTYRWAHKAGASWPCSTLSGRRFMAQFDTHGDLVDLTVDGRDAPEDLEGNELSAICADLIETARGTK